MFSDINIGLTVGIIAALATIVAPLLVWSLERRKNSIGMMDSLISSIETLEKIKGHIDNSLYERLKARYESLLVALCPVKSNIRDSFEYKIATISWRSAYKDHGLLYLLRKYIFWYKPISITISIIHFYGAMMSIVSIAAIFYAPVSVVTTQDPDALLIGFVGLTYALISVFMAKLVNWNAKKRAKLQEQPDDLSELKS